MVYAAFPPEINSGRIYAGPGSGPMRAAAAAWDGLAAELQATTAAYASVISSLTSGAWLGPSAFAMAAAVAPHLTWMSGTAVQAAQAATQASTAASAYDTAFAAHVPPVEIAANRSRLVLLVATNLFGQNSSAIAVTEAEYSEMWAQDAAAMDSYAGSSAAATQLTPFTEPPQIANADGLASQAAAAAQSSSTSAGSAQSIVSSLAASTNPVSDALQEGANLATRYTAFWDNVVNTLFYSTAAKDFETVYTILRDLSSPSLQFNYIFMASNMPIGMFLQYAGPPAAGGEVLPPVVRGAELFDAISPDVSAHFARGTSVGALTVPPSWTAATPAIRTIAAALSAAGPEAAPAALSQSSLFSSMSVAGMLGSAFGAAAPSAVTRTDARSRAVSLKDLKDGTSPETLKRLAAKMSEKPESVQHHNVDKAGLDDLLAELSKKPGIHAVHVSKKSKVVPPEAQSG